MKYISHSKGLEVSLIDISGKECYHGRIPAYAYIHNIDVGSFVSGMYCVLLKDGAKLLGTKKVMIGK